MKTEIELKEEALIKVWNILDNMWGHHGDGSDLWPVPMKFRDEGLYTTDYDGLIAARNFYKDKCNHPDVNHTVNESLVFDIVFNEIKHIVRNNVSKENQKLLR